MPDHLDILKRIEDQNSKLVKMVELLQRENRCMKMRLGEIYQKVNRLDSMCNDTNLDSHIKEVINAVEK